MGSKDTYGCRERSKSSFAGVGGIGSNNASLAFLNGIRFLKVHKGFIPFYAPRELSIAIKRCRKQVGLQMVQEGCKENNNKKK